MIQKTVEENKELIKKYPWLLPKNIWTDEIVENYDYSWTELDEVPDGWRIAFGDLLCEDIQAELEKCDFVDKYRIVQIKEKYGGLRWYDNGIPTGCKVHDIIDNYSHISEYICICCGELDVPSTNGWITPVCKKCINKMNIKNPEEYWNTISKEQYPYTLPLERHYYVWSKDKNDPEEVIVDMTSTVKKIRAKYAERKKL